MEICHAWRDHLLYYEGQRGISKRNSGVFKADTGKDYGDVVLVTISLATLLACPISTFPDPRVGIVSI